MKSVCILLAALSVTSPAIAGGDIAPQPYYTAPPVVVVAPPVNPAYAIGGFVGGIVAMPFEFLGGFFGMPQYPPAALVPDGYGGWVPATNSPYDPVSGQFLPPGMPLQPQGGPVQPAVYDPPAPVYHAPRRPSPRPSMPPADRSTGGCYDGGGKFIGGGNWECAG